MFNSTESYTTTRAKIITQYVEHENSFVFKNALPATIRLAGALDCTLANVYGSAIDEFNTLSEEDYNKGFTYLIPQGGYNNNVGIEMKRHGINCTKVTIYNKFFTPEQTTLESYLVDGDETLPTFVALVKQHAK